jgi:hypothetical protein
MFANSEQCNVQAALPYMKILFVYYSIVVHLASKSSRPALGSTQPPIKWVPGALCLAAKRPGREAENSSPTSAELKKIWIYTSIPPYAFIA